MTRILIHFVLRQKFPILILLFCLQSFFVIGLPNFFPYITTKRCIAGQLVNVFEPYSSSTQTGVTFMLTGAMAPVRLYSSTIEVIREQNQYVIAIISNVFFPPDDNHRYRAEKIKEIFDSFRVEHPELPDTYSLVGHSAGGKISLLVAAVYDSSRVTTVIALDPVDLNPPEFTPSEHTNTTENSTYTLGPYESLSDLNATIILTQSSIYEEPGYDEFDPAHNAYAIHEMNPNTTVFVYHKDAGHNAYTDLNIKFIVPLGNPDANIAAKKDTFDMIREYIG